MNHFKISVFLEKFMNVYQLLFYVFATVYILLDNHKRQSTKKISNEIWQNYSWWVVNESFNHAELKMWIIRSNYANIRIVFVSNLWNHETLDTYPFITLCRYFIVEHTLDISNYYLLVDLNFNTTQTCRNECKRT